ncbi:MAG: hypothetical protein SH817_10780 [Leptospira sp.]|nr:hypothetical protein [Leptospira sp.]
MKWFISFVMFLQIVSCRYNDDESKLPEGKLLFLPNGIISALNAAAGYCVIGISKVNDCKL